jgi:hypothetical protein
MYNFMGDYIAVFDGNTLKQINEKMRERVSSTLIPSRNTTISLIPNYSFKKFEIEGKETDKIKGYYYYEKLKNKDLD